MQLINCSTPKEGKWMPRRIQRRRAKGWRMPEGVIYVGGPTKYGNPFIFGQRYEAYGYEGTYYTATLENCLTMFHDYLQGRIIAEPDFLEPLRGKDLACWCPLTSPCHADILLRLANS